MASKALVGRDCTVFSFQAGGLDESNTVFNGGVITDYLGNWKNISVDFDQTLVNITHSSAQWQEKRRTVSDWKCRISGCIRANLGSLFLTDVISNDYAFVTFTECIGGRTVSLLGMIKSTTMKRDENDGEETLDLEGFGAFGADNGGITYV